MPDVLNLAAYKFVRLVDAAALRERLHTLAEAAELRGTVLVAEEGLNLMLAGAPAAARGFVARLQTDARFADLEVKESWSASAPFQRLKVKLKREIIRMDHPTLRPDAGRAPALAAATLARWLDDGHDDAGRPVLMLDTRNDFEVDAGRFRGALDWRLGKFGDFPAALQAGRDALAGHTVVSYCTGGIRCEKAALLMQAEGVAPVWQLDGGLLRYFETVGARHFDGRCVVFDARGALDSALRPAA